jgi:hypothetical protein
MGTRTRDLPARSIVPQPTTLPRSAKPQGQYTKYIYRCGLLISFTEMHKLYADMCKSAYSTVDVFYITVDS